MDVDDYESPEKIAEFVRAAWQMPRGPIGNLISLVESMGAIVIPFDFGTDDVDAVGQWTWGLPPLFFLNSAAPTDRMRFSLAHEIGHIVMHRVPTPDLEKEADRFAAELLLPAADITDELRALTLQKAMRLKLRWRVSAQALITKAKTTKAVSDRKYASLYSYLSKLGYRKKEPFTLAPEVPTTLSRLVGLHISHLGYSLDDLCQIAFVSDEEFRLTYLGESNDPDKPLRFFG
jgi:Zn-dependent peptidase ImmA (M78 family)